MSRKITLVDHLKSCAQAAKTFAGGLVAELAQTVTEAIEEMDGAKADKGQAVSVSIPTAGWTSDTSVAAYPYRYDIPASGVTAADRAEVTVAPSGLAAASACGLCPTCETVAGAIRIRAKTAPTAEIAAQYWISKGTG